MSIENEVLSSTVPNPDKNHSIVQETYWKSQTVNGTYCVLAVAGCGVKIYVIVDKNCKVITSEMDNDENGYQLIQRFSQIDSKKSNNQWVKVKTREIPEPIYSSLRSEIVTIARSL